MRIKYNDESAVEVDLAPLIDCVFLLLIFFLVASSLKNTEYETDIPQRIPPAFSEKVSGESSIVEVSKSGSFLWAGKKYTIGTAGSLLEGAKKIASNLKFDEIEIRAHPEISSGSVLLFVDALRVAGIKTIDIRLVTDVR